VRHVHALTYLSMAWEFLSCGAQQSCDMKSPCRSELAWRARNRTNRHCKLALLWPCIQDRPDCLSSTMRQGRRTARQHLSKSEAFLVRTIEETPTDLHQSFSERSTGRSAAAACDSSCTAVPRRSSSRSNWDCCRRAEHIRSTENDRHVSSVDPKGQKIHSQCSGIASVLENHIASSGCEPCQATVRHGAARTSDLAPS
jgi:hypothetical protein